MTSTFGTTDDPVHPAAPNPLYGFPPAALVPTDAPPPPVLHGAQMKQRNPFLVWLVFPVITLGIYSLVWYFKIHNEMLRFDPRQPIKPAGSLLTVMFGGIIIVPPFVSYFNTGNRIATVQRADMIIVSMASARQTPMYDPLSHLVYVTRGDDVRSTIVNGKVLMRDRKMLTLDENAVLAEARSWSDKVRAAVGR